HDFNNLLTGMMAQTSLALKKLPAEHQAVKNIQKANIAAERAADLTRQLLAYTGQGGFKIEKVNLNNIIRENVTLIQATLPPNVALELDLQPALSLIEADPSQIQQIAMNLVINAVEAIKENKGKVQIHTSLCAKNAIEPTKYNINNFQPETEHFVCLQVQDNGMGIKPEILDRIFDPFFSTKSGSRGLGLAASLGIVRRYNGGIQVDTPAAGGSCFTIYLPTLADSFDAKRSEDRTHELLDLNIPKLSGKKILIIDDEVSVRDAIQDIFELVSIDSLIAENGYQGLEIYQTHKDIIGLIILDLKMPGQSGMETLQQIHQLNKKVPVLISSGYTEEKAAEHFADQVTHFLPKPFKAHSLLKAIQDALEA
ncbi:MAG: response regulator, partial [Anaerolineales bacterium]|nr:response regulator [Anaerolineales bacterium]